MSVVLVSSTSATITKSKRFLFHLPPAILLNFCPRSQFRRQDPIFSKALYALRRHRLYPLRIWRRRSGSRKSTAKKRKKTSLSLSGKIIGFQFCWWRIWIRICRHGSSSWVETSSSESIGTIRNGPPLMTFLLTDSLLSLKEVWMRMDTCNVRIMDGPLMDVDLVLGFLRLLLQVLKLALLNPKRACAIKFPTMVSH